MKDIKVGDRFVYYRDKKNKKDGQYYLIVDILREREIKCLVYKDEVDISNIGMSSTIYSNIILEYCTKLNRTIKYRND